MFKCLEFRWSFKPDLPEYEASQILHSYLLPSCLVLMCSFKYCGFGNDESQVVQLNVLPSCTALVRMVNASFL